MSCEVGIQCTEEYGLPLYSGWSLVMIPSNLNLSDGSAFDLR